MTRTRCLQIVSARELKMRRNQGMDENSVTAATITISTIMGEEPAEVDEHMLLSLIQPLAYSPERTIWVIDTSRKKQFILPQ